MEIPSKYWRIACPLNEETPLPSSSYTLPPSITNHSSPPKFGQGLLLAAYDEDAQTGLVRYIGIITAGTGSVVTVDWRPVQSEIWVDTVAGRRFWLDRPAFAFARDKVPVEFHAILTRHFHPILTHPLCEPGGSRCG